MHATNATVHVHRMVEINVVRDLVNLNPGNRFASLRTFPDQGQRASSSAPGYGSSYTWNWKVYSNTTTFPPYCGSNDNRAPVDPHALSEGNRPAGSLIADPGVLRCKIIPNSSRHPATHQQSANDDVKRQPVRPLRENLWHVMIPISNASHPRKPKRHQLKAGAILAGRRETSTVFANPVRAIHCAFHRGAASIFASLDPEARREGVRAGRMH